MTNGNGNGHSNLRNGGKGSHGGPRKGAGAKKKWYTILHDRLVAERGNDANRAFDLIVQIMDNPEEPSGLRRECANDVMNRIWGKPKETLTHNMPNGAFISIVTHGESTTNVGNGSNASQT